MKIYLPDLNNYKKKLIENGLTFPLDNAAKAAEGLLMSLPGVKSKSGWPWDEEVDPRIYREDVDWPKLTIVTPSYNQASFIEQTIRSVLLQNYPNLEYIVIDGGSTDNTKEILEKYSPWISYWQSEKDDGQSQAINLGFSIASGDYYAWINSDDYYCKDVFKLVITNFLKHRIEFVYGYSASYSQKENEMEIIKVRRLYDYLLRIPTLQQPSCFWLASIHQPVWEALHCSLDFELWLRMVKGKKRKLLKHVLTIANKHDDAKTHNPKMGAAWKHDHELICSEDAHGPVNNWQTINFLHRILLKLNKLIEKNY
ncbi:glycosyltransferase family 2 protein [Pedobacter aquatilis]|uniref:glycosyltransferase family 2 protein n=1 Tax=Pedobacter aquatilis TaxID=351343 RepID=UPI00292EAF2A|nr:glycosyltransferase family 2 protein [Pedobacter aquatilis]